MRTAIYSRYSTARQDDETIAVQTSVCEDYAKRQNWQVVKRYNDRGISGSSDQRPGFQKMMADAKAREFDCVLVYDLSRFARNLVLQLQSAELLAHWSIRLIGVKDSQDSNSAIFKLQMSVLGAVNEHYRDQTGIKVRDAMARLVREGRPTGGKVYGYRTETAPDGTKRRVIVQGEAKVINRIFRLYADGVPLEEIAHTLNREGIPSPRGRRWSASAIHGHQGCEIGLLNNTTYIGVVRWNRGRWVHTRKATGNPNEPTLERKAVPEAEWVTHSDPSLRIIPQALWDRVKSRQQEMQAKTEKRVASRKASTGGRHGKHLLSGLLKCGECGSNYSIRGTAHYKVNGNGERRSKAYYGCAHAFHHGTCKNTTTVRLDIAEEKVLAALRSDLFKPEAFAAFKASIRKKLQQAKAARLAGNSDAKRRLADLDRKIGNLVRAIEDGEHNDKVKARLAQLEAERKELTTNLKSDKLDKVEELLPKMEERYQALVNNMTKALPPAELSRSRRIVAGLLGDVILRPTADGGLNAEMKGQYPGLLSLFDNGHIRFAQRKSR